MMLALTLCLILLPFMCLSFRPVFRRLTKIDLVFSFLSFSTGKCRPGGREDTPSVLPQDSLFGFGEVYLKISVLLTLSLNVSWDLCPTVSVLSSFSVGVSVGGICLSFLLPSFSFCFSPGVFVSAQEFVCLCMHTHLLVMEGGRGEAVSVSLLFMGVSWGSCPAFVSVSPAPPQCRVPDRSQSDALCSQL